MLRRITITKLFGYFNHTIALNLDERITIIHGPNGCGKTTILRLLSDLFAHNFQSLMATPYDAIRLDFTDRSSLTIHRKEDRRRGRDAVLRARLLRQGSLFDDAEAEGPGQPVPEHELPPVSLRFVLQKPGLRKPRTHLMQQYNDMQRIYDVNISSHDARFLEHVGPSLWIDTRTGRRFSDREVMRRRRSGFGYHEYYVETMPKWLAQCMQSVKAEFIETHRLLAPQSQAKERGRGEEMASAVLLYSGELAKTIQDALAESAALSQVMDQTFPRRVLTERMPDVTEAEIRRKYVEQAEKRKRLMEAGLINEEPDVALPVKPLDKTEMKILWCYLNDVIRKLEVFNALLFKIELLKDSLNSRFRHKKLAVDKTKGMVFRTEAGQELSPTALSSGEQHEVVLTYKLLFRVGRGALILIDEPELSLHVTWQHKFIEDMMRIASLSDLQLLVATHSPQIVHNRWDLTVRLGDRA